MAGRNHLSSLSDLGFALPKLDVLDAHSNHLTGFEGLEKCLRLRVLNLAANQLESLNGISILTSLVELNLRRNCISLLAPLHALEKLKRLYLSGNKLSDCVTLLHLNGAQSLVELSLEENPINDSHPVLLRSWLISSLPRLKALSNDRVGAEERAEARTTTSELRFALLLYAEKEAQEKASNVLDQSNSHNDTEIVVLSGVEGFPCLTSDQSAASIEPSPLSDVLNALQPFAPITHSTSPEKKSRFKEASQSRPQHENLPEDGAEKLSDKVVIIIY